MRSLVAFGLSVLLLAGCQPPVPDSRSAAVGFEDYGAYQRRRAAEAEAALRAPVQTVQGPVQNAALPYPPPAVTGAPTAADLAQAGIGSATLAAPGTAVAPVEPALPAGVPPANPVVVESSSYPEGLPATAGDHTGISDEQDFQAVASRETIESDKARIAQNRAAYQQIPPTDLPERTSASEAAVDLVQYALKAPNRLGEAIYPRSRIALGSSERACARYDSPEAAQQAFLAAGGPQRDRKNLDPDGDGFACFWDPTPFQQAKN